MVPGYSVDFSYDGRRGGSINPKPVVSSAPALVKNARERTLGVRVARKFLQENLRGMNSDHLVLFKNHLDVLFA